MEEASPVGGGGVYFPNAMTRHDKGGGGRGGDVVHDIMFGETTD